MAALVQGSYLLTKSFAISKLALRGGARLRLGTPCRGSGKLRNYTAAAGASELPTHFTLPSGDKIPSVALGVWQAPPNQVGDAVTAALKAGYRHIDGAWAYRNEDEVGKALKASGVPRDQVWLTSKLWNSFHAPEDVEPALDESLKALGVDYLDLYLIHWPIALKKGTNNEVDEALTANPYPTWQKLEELVDKGKVRNIGVSNFNIPRLRNLTANPLKYKPAINQVELSYWNPQPDLVKWAKENGLLLEAYSPLGSSDLVRETFNVPEVKEISRALSITPAQAIISWHVQRGTVVLPKSVTPSRVEENFHVRKLPDELFNKLEKASQAHEPRRVVNPSKRYNLGYDIFDDDGGVIVPDEDDAGERSGAGSWRTGV
ncbi:NADP-dependent oxidoreductase domain-containing protein [Dichomitus squalens]|uniref:NADP-dependent oxidoreductase domain-containing protein n=1 Tax=Dichomitus squalens TaxID=114155 RepID=A0A4Q9M561_9APHY|nr:NADP-dependent oxidoreductase domain-containing protein [Dichomitus squalens]